jgi:hypothetical protein
VEEVHIVNVNLIGDGYFEVELMGEIKQIRRLLEKILEANKQMLVNFDALTAEVTRVRDVEASALTLLQGIVDQLKQLSAELASVPEAQAAIDGFVTSLEEQTAPLAEAVSANTPSAAKK